MDYNKLYTFIKVAESGGITRAARGLRRTQSAITQQVQQLEAELGLQLFERQPPRLLLSREGTRLCELAACCLGGIDDLVAALKDDV